MQAANKLYVYILSVSILHAVLFKIEGVQTQSGQKSRQQCAIYRWAGINPNFFGTIAGGTKVFEFDYPHMAALGYGSAQDRKWKCGGTLISEKFVLTAAHCLRSRTDGDVKVVRLGAKNIEKPRPGYRDYDISERIRHPRFKVSQRYDDIGLLRLSVSVTFTSKIKPACLQVNTYFDDSNMSATGWGDQGNLQPASPDLLEVDLILYNYTTCKPYFDDVRELPYGVQPQSMICAGGARNQIKDTCQGDSGGPLQIFVDQQYHVVGVTSFGRTCALANVPAIYTRVSNYIPWIESTVWK